MACRSDRDIQISKSLSWLLRHGAAKEGIVLNAEGYAKLSHVLQNTTFRGCSFTDVERIVGNCEKRRFTVRKCPEDGHWEIKANQGHSIPIDKLELLPVTDPAEVPVAVHGTTRQNWEKIKIHGLSRMARQHIHMACGQPDDTKVISGMRKSCDVHIYIDINLAMKDGIKFFLSPNKVVLSAGDERGLIPPKYFTKVVHA